MDFELTERQKMLVIGLREMLTKDYSKEYFRKLEDDEIWPSDVLKKMGELGYIALGVPEKDGGLGGDTVDVTLCIEEAAHQMGGPAMAYFTAVCFGARAIALFGTEKQKSELLPGLMAGTSWMGLSLTEPGGGTDILAMASKAKKDGNGSWVINGSKIFTTGAHIASHVIAVVRTSGFEEKRARGITMFLVPTNADGLDIKRIPIFTQRSTGANEVFFNDVRVSEDSILGELDKGVYALFGILNDERIGASAMCIGISQAALDEAVEYAKVRTAFGRPIGQFQAIQHSLAECWTRLQAARYLVYRAAWLQANNISAEMESSAAKLFASQTAVWLTNECMEVLGGYQASLDFSMNYYFRDCRYTFAPITNNAVRNLIGERLELGKSY